MDYNPNPHVDQPRCIQSSGISMIWNVMRFHIYNLLDDHNPLQRDNSFALFLLQQLYTNITSIKTIFKKTDTTKRRNNFGTRSLFSHKFFAQKKLGSWFSLTRFMKRSGIQSPRNKSRARCSSLPWFFAEFNKVVNICMPWFQVPLGKANDSKNEWWGWWLGFLLNKSWDGKKTYFLRLNGTACL